MNKKYLTTLHTLAHKKVSFMHIKLTQLIIFALTDGPWGFHSFCRKTFIDIYPEKIGMSGEWHKYELPIHAQKDIKMCVLIARK